MTTTPGYQNNPDNIQNDQPVSTQPPALPELSREMDSTWDAAAMTSQREVG